MKVTFSHVAKILLISIFIFGVVYFISYLYIKYKYCSINKPKNFISSVIDKEEWVDSVLFFDKASDEVRLYYTFLPAAQFEKIFNSDLLYDLTGIYDEERHIFADKVVRIKEK